MRVRRVLRIIDAMTTQGRAIIHLDCGHNLSIQEAALNDSPLLLVHATERGTWACPICPDAPAGSADANPADEFRALFKEE